MIKNSRIYLNNLLTRYPELNECKNDIESSYNILVACYKNRGKLLVAGNGGSGADSGHIVGELMKGFLSKRTLAPKVQDTLINSHKNMGVVMAKNLQGALPAIDLTAHGSLITAFSNDVHGDLIFAQQVIGYGVLGDVFLGISTSGNAKNILYGMHAAKSLGLKTIGLTGNLGGKMKEIADITINVPADKTPTIQELHLPVYHTLCAMIEAHFFKD